MVCPSRSPYRIAPVAMKLIAPITRVTIANDEFMSGDGWLKFVSIELGEDARSSSCRFELADPGMEVAGKYFSISFKEGGIKVPADLLSAPPAQPQSPTVAGTGLKGVADAPVGQPLEVGAPKLGDRQWNDELLIRECLRQGVTNPRQIAYILATAYHETGAYSLVKEGGGPDYLSYLEFRDDLGNNAPGDGIKYAGRGYVQITGKTNYQKYQDLLGLPLIETPELIEQNAGLAAFTTVHGISTNIFTGNGSAQRAFESGGDFLAMSFLVNDYGALPDGGRALGLLLGYCEDYLGRLTSGDLAPLLQGAVPAAPATPPVSDATKPQTTPPATGESPPAQNPAPAKPEEVSQKGTEIIIELGYQLDQLISFHFIHVGTSTSGRSPGNTTFEGQCVRWLMARRTKNATYENVTLRQLAEIVCMSYGLELEMEGDGPTYQFLDQTGISDYQLLLREAQSIGYRITDDGIILKISPWRPKFTGFVITPDILDKISFTDRAKAEMQGAPSTTTKTSEPDATAGEQKMAFDRETGQMVQVKPEDSTGTGDGMVATTGAAIAPMHGTVQETDDAPEEDTPAPDPETGTDSSPPENDPRENNAGGPRPPSSLAAQSNPFAEEKTGLPTQEIGAIDLADGKAEAIAIKDESRRVKGYESSASFKTTPEALTLAPGSIIAIAEECF
ncbi:MAG: hypothetical protein ACRC8Y_24230, partial [Chroococcales cyanobacterium]